MAVMSAFSLSQRRAQARTYILLAQRRAQARTYIVLSISVTALAFKIILCTV